jgi:hypothetical protein
MGESGSGIDCWRYETIVHTFIFVESLRTGRYPRAASSFNRAKAVDGVETTVNEQDAIIWKDYPKCSDSLALFHGSGKLSTLPRLESNPFPSGSLRFSHTPALNAAPRLPPSTKLTSGYASIFDIHNT